ncbi:protein distal antenna [Aricia agestis]|uniref:protein distal antenna n=1 Tax=Aricia agestis TaxID=91739 RepID=UPI001C206936|nr:protein distal antenna [Aricia agestis]
MTTKGKRPMRALTPGDKIEAIQRVNDGESKASVARDIGVPESTLRGWCKNEDKLRYMTSRLSSPDTDKSNDGEPADKRARTESPAAPHSPAPSGLDLTHAAHAPRPAAPDAPVELTTRRPDPSPPAPAPRERRPDPGASVSMSAISPLSGLPHLPALSHSHLGLSFNEIATNLTLLAQLNPGLSTLAAQPGSRALRSVRSPKPNGVLNLNESKHRSKSNHSSDPYRHSSSKSHHGNSHAAPGHPVDDSLWYWIKTHQAMFDFSAQTAAAHPLHLGKAAEPAPPPKPVAPAPPVSSHLEFNRDAWLWQYCKQIGGAVPLPEDRHKSASQVPKDKSADNILYSHLTKAKPEDDRGSAATLPRDATTAKTAPETPAPGGEQRVAAPAPSPEPAAENKEPSPEKPSEVGRNPSKVRNVLDNLLFNNNNNNNNQITSEDAKSASPANGEWESGTLEALEHGEKFLSWLEVSGDPSVTRTHVHQLRSLLHNLRARRAAAAPPAARH